MQEILGIILRVLIMYIYALVLLRISGKRNLGNLSALDFVTVLLVGDQFDNVFWGSSPLSSGLVGISVLIGWSILTGYAVYRFPALGDILLGSRPTQVVQDGVFLQKGLAKLRLSEEEARSLLRQEGEENIDELRSVNVEEGGGISIGKQPQAKDAQKIDFPKLKAKIS